MNYNPNYNSGSWDDFLEEKKLGTDKLLDVSVPKPITWAFTVSPPKRYLPLKLACLLDMLFYEQYIKMGVMEVHPEFDMKQRLHYHIIITPRQGNLYGLDYEFFTFASLVKNRQLKLFYYDGQTAKGKIKWRKSKTTKLTAFCCFKTENIDEKWEIYCNKQSEETKKILEFDILTYDILCKLRNIYLLKYKWEIRGL